jgi:2-polyprenyl-3-methyl-5-hydroxy-6-metoxy-1,4-benzoquinol methylase
MCNIPIDDGCPLCGDRNHRAFAEQRGVSIHLCEVCGFMFVFPPPEEGSLRSLYQLSSGYYATASENLKDTSKWSAVQLHQLLAEHGVAPGRFLEIGCSSGSLIYHLQELGWDVVGVEVNPGTARIARDNGLVVYLGTVESIVESVALKGELFDVIYLGDVIEHLPQPLQTLSLLRSVMRPGGTLILRTPNSLCGYAQASLKYAQVFRAPWYYSEAPYHLCEFTPTTLRALITRAGFTVSSLLCQPPRVP